MPKLNTDDYMTLAECAQQLGCTYSTVWRWTDSGRLPYIERFNLRLVKRTDCKRPETLDSRGPKLGAKRGGE